MASSMICYEQKKMLLLSDQKGRIIEIDDSLCKFLGQESEKLVGAKLEHLNISDLKKNALLLLQQDAACNFGQFTGFYRQKDGSATLLEISVKKICIRGEKLLEIALQDPCEQKIKESLLLTEAIEQSANAILVGDLDGKIIYINEKFCRMSGYTREELVGENTRILKSGAQPPEFYRAMFETVRCGGTWHGKVHNRKKTGEFYWETVIMSPVRDATGRVCNFLAIKEDITIREEAAAVLRKADQKLRNDMVLAGKIQRTILPQDLILKDIKVKTVYEPINIVSGDVYDYVWLQDERRLVGYVADVMGHGLGAALQTSALMVLGRQFLQGQGALAEKVRELNRNLAPYLDDSSFAALLAFEIDLKNGLIRYVSAGINHFIAIQAGEVMVVRVPGIFLGILPEMEYEEAVLTCQSGDCFYFCSDGMLEMMLPEQMESLTDYEQGMKLLAELVTDATANDDATAVGIKL